jgi:cell division protein FtsZ
MEQAKKGIDELSKAVDTLIHIPNNRLRSIAHKGASFFEMLKKADTVLRDAVRGISDLIVKPGLINLDFADVRTVMREMGMAMMGTGQANGDSRTMKAVEAAINNPLLNEINIKGALSVLMNVTAPPEITIDELEDASNKVRDLVHEDANIIWGCVQDENMGSDVRITIIATGINSAAAEAATHRLKVSGGQPLVCGGQLDMPGIDMLSLNQVPPYARNSGNSRNQRQGAMRGNDKPNMDIPTYMRRKAD